MDWTARNLQALEQRFPHWQEDVAGRTQPLPALMWSAARSGAVLASLDGVGLASAFDPEREAQRLVDGLPAGDFDYAILPGLGLGYTARALRRKHPELPILVVEPDPALFLALLAGQDLSALLLDPLISFQFPHAPGAVRLFMSLFPRHRVLRLPHRPYQDRYAGFCQLLDQEINKYQTKLQINSNTLDRFGRLWLRNLSRNLLELDRCQPLSLAAGLGRGRPAVICAAGPSLERELEFLRDHRDNYLLIAVDTVYHTLLRRGLVADYLVFMDGQYWNSRHVDHPVHPQTAIVTELAGPPRAFRLNPDRTLLARSATPFGRDFEAGLVPGQTDALGELKSGGSVATSAWELARWLGCTTVVMAGLDLGYPAGQTHVRGSQFEEMTVRSGRRLRPSETAGLRLLGEAGLVRRPANNGGHVLSDPRMDLYREWFEVALLSHPEVETWNLSPTGVVIQGMKPGGREILQQSPASPLAQPDWSRPKPWAAPAEQLARRWTALLADCLARLPALRQALPEASPSAWSALADRLPLPGLRQAFLAGWEGAWTALPTERHHRQLALALDRLEACLTDWQENFTFTNF